MVEEAELLQKTYGENLIKINRTSILTIVSEILTQPIVAFEIVSLIILFVLQFQLYFVFLSILLSY